MTTTSAPASTSTRGPGTWIAGGAVLAVLLVVGAWFLVLGPQRAQAQDLATQTNAAKAQNQQIADKTAQLKSLAAQLPDRQKRLAEIMAAMPSSDDVPGLLRQFATSATSAGVELTSVTPGTPALWNATATPKAGEPTVVAIPVDLTFSGTFPQSELYLKQLQADSTRFLLLDSVSVAAGGTAAQGSAVTVSLSGKVFVLADQVAATTVPAAGTVGGPSATSSSAAPAAAPTATATATGATAIPTSVATATATS
jgi:type IV pilus assembly protein PilO